MTIRGGAWAMVALSLLAMALGAALMPVLTGLATGNLERPDPGASAMLVAAEAVKLVSAWVMWRLATMVPASPTFGAVLLRIAAGALALAGLAGLAGVALVTPQAVEVVQMLALAALVATAAWGICCARAATRSRPILFVAAGVTLVAAFAALVQPAAGMLAALSQIAFWSTLAAGRGKQGRAAG